MSQITDINKVLHCCLQ